MAWRDEDGYFWFVGRTDDVIKSSGYRIGPFEVESALLEHPAVLECAVTGVPDAMRGARSSRPPSSCAKDYEPSEELVEELQEHVKKVTAPYKYPRIVEFVDGAAQDHQRQDPARGDPGAGRRLKAGQGRIHPQGHQGNHHLVRRGSSWRSPRASPKGRSLRPPRGTRRASPRP